MSTKSASPSFSISDAFGEGWNVFQAQAGSLLSILAVTIVVQVLTGVVQGFAQRNMGGLIAALVYIAAMGIRLVLSIGVVSVFLKVSRGKKVAMDELWTHTDLIVNYLIGTVMLGLMIGLGFVFFIVPGVYLMLKYMFVPYLIVDKKLNPFEALTQSSNMTDGIKLQLLGFAIVGWLINVAGALALLIGLVVTIPVTGLAGAYVYNQLLKRAEA